MQRAEHATSARAHDDGRGSGRETPGNGYAELTALLVNTMPSPVDGRGWPCGEDPDLWFAERPEDVETAKRICQGCPVRRRCLADALARREPWGVWGGELVIHGRVVARKRGRGRPRKDAEAA